MALALITGATRGLGHALASALAAHGHDLVLSGRDQARLTALRAQFPRARIVPGDVTDPHHRAALGESVGGGPLDLLVHSAGTLGPSPLPPLEELPAADLRRIFEVNVVAPTALTTLLLPALRRATGTVVTISSDAAVEHYPGWGGYAAGKAALDHLAGTWAVEHADVRFYAVDPGDMRTAMHQEAFPGEDISDRPLPEEVAVPGILALLQVRPASGRFRAGEFATVFQAGTR